MSNQDTLYAQLRRAYELIQAGQRQAALQILGPICRHDPNNASAWWLAAHALEESSQVRYALNQVIRIDPNYPGVARKLARLNAVVSYQYPHDRPVHGEIVASNTTYRPIRNLIPNAQPVPQAAPPRTLPKKSNFPAILSTLALVAIGFAFLATILLYDFLRNEAPRWTDAVISMIETRSAENTARQGTPLYLPPPNPTSIPAGFPGPATPNPARFGDTYWDGAGDGVTMDYLAIDGRYRRFYKFPVRLYVTGAIQEPWISAVNESMRQISQVVPITLASRRSEADITLEILSPMAVQRQCVGLSFTRVVGCASIDYEPGFMEPRISGMALIATDTNNPTGTIIHELLHALGVVVHSPYQTDIMYFEETDQIVTNMSERDLNTLRRLYASPSYAD